MRITLRKGIGLAGLVLLVLCIGKIPSYAQQLVTGKVVDAADNEPVIGATVKIKNGLTGTQTNVNGEFQLSAPVGAVLEISYIGYLKREVAAEFSGTMLIALQVDSKTLDEVVVVGYGTQKKATLTGAVEQVSAKAFEDRAVTNVGLALQGQTPGLVITRNSPRPGNEGIGLQIRGATSVNGGSPLVLVDGVPEVDGNAWLQMNPDDIESVSVLKDGAAAIYGARAANGVVLITTKRGKDGKLKIDYSNNLRFTTNGITGYSPSTAEYAKMWIEANKEETTPFWWVWNSKENMELLAGGYEGIIDFNNAAYGLVYVANANRLNEMFATRYSYQHNLSLSGRSDKSGYRLSFALADNQGNLATAYDGQKQYNMRFNHDYKFSDRIKFESGVSMQNVVTSTPSVGIDGALYANDMPFFPAKNPLGQWNANFGRVGNRNAAAATSDGGRNSTDRLMGRIDLKGTVDIYKGLSAEAMTSLQMVTNRNEKYIIPVPLYDWFGGPSSETHAATAQSLTAGKPGYSSYYNNNYYQYFAGFLKYNKNFNGHNISADLGIDAQKYQWKNLSAAREQFEDTGIYDLKVADATVQSTGGGKSQEGLYSYISRLNYDYQEKYLLTLIGRRDGSSRFADGYKFKSYGSVSLGWVFSREDFMHNIDWLTFGKLRASYGSTANQVGIGTFDYVSGVNLGSVAIGYPAALQSSSSLAGNGLISKERTWELVYQQNIALDLVFLNNRLTSTIDFFQKDNKGMLVNVNYPSILGGSAPKTNNGHLTTKGWELVLGWRDKVQDFSYNVSFNVSNTKNLLKSMEGQETYTAGKNSTVVGFPLNSWFLYQTGGPFISQEDVDAYYAWYGTNAALNNVAQNTAAQLRPGDTFVYDYNGDGVISSEFDASKAIPADYRYMGDAAPHYVFGLNLGGNYKGFDLNTFFQGVGRQYIVRQGWMAYPFATTYTNQPIAFLGQTWTESNPDAYYPRLSIYPAKASWNYANRDFMLQNSRYIRLKTLVLGYTLPQKVSRKMKLDRLRVYFSGNDLWELTSIKDGYDPEQGETTQNSGYPFGRTWAFGLNIGL